MDVGQRLDAITEADLRAAGSLKWSRPGPDGYGAFIAEMDFGVAPPVVEALAELSDRARFGYLTEAMSAELGEATAEWIATRYGWQVDPTDVHPLPDVMKGLEVAITHLSRPGAPIVLPTPAYMPFLLVPLLFGREIIEVPMRDDGTGLSTFDLDGIDRAFSAGGDLLVLCNPYNPLGRVFDRAELAAVAEVVERHHGRVFADEIHAPLVYAPARHVPYASLSSVTAGHTVTATSASKAFNLPGLKCAQLVLSNDADREVWAKVGLWFSHGAANPGVVANVAAYRHGLGWFDDVLSYLNRNRMLLADLVAEHLPGVRYRPLDGTYLAWLDFSDLGLSESPGLLMAERAHVFLIDGPACGAAGAGAVRLTFATPAPVLEGMVARMGAGLRAAASSGTP